MTISRNMDWKKGNVEPVVEIERNVEHQPIRFIKGNFWEHYPYVGGWFGFIELYDLVLRRFRKGIFVEVGCLFGRSTIYMAHEIKRRGYDIEFYTVDHWRGTNTEPDYHSIMEQVRGNMFPQFCINNFLCDTIDVIKPLMIDSVRAARCFDDNSLTFVCLDAGHTYDEVMADIKAWWPKIRKGGILGGDDYSWGFPGVIRATTDFFGDVNTFEGEGQQGWWVKKG